MSASTLGDLLGETRRQRFVGRTQEIQLFREALSGGLAVLHVTGPGGIGKSRLLDHLSAIAEDAGRSVVRVDGREPANRRALQELVAEPRVVVIDDYDRLGPLDDWLRTALVPALPLGSVLLLASRAGLSEPWRTDPAWHQLVREVSLRNFGPEETNAYLTSCGVTQSRTARLHALTHGHPLAVALVAQVSDDVDQLPPDVVGALLERFVDRVPSVPHQRSLEALAIARVTTEDLLRDVLETDDAGPLFGWLRSLTFVQATTDGLRPHDLARDAVEADLRWRDPEGHTRMFRRVRAHIHRRLRALQGTALQRAIYDEKFLWRHHPQMSAHLDLSSMGLHFTERAVAADRGAVLDIVERWEGADSAALAARWWNEQPAGFTVVRRPDGTVRGVLALVDLTQAETLRHDDPGARAAWQHAQRTAPPRPGERVTQLRFMVDAEAGQAPSPTVNTGPITGIEHWLTHRDLAWDFVTVADPDAWEAFFEFTPLARSAADDFTLGGVTYGVFGCDLRRTPVDAWLEQATEQALAREFTVPERAPDRLVLSRPDFEGAVRQGLRTLHRPDELAANPLLRSAALFPGPDGDLAALLRRAAEGLRADPRDEHLWHVVDRTYLRPAATQQLAADVLDLPMSTYKRHLRRAVARIVEDLWELELAPVRPSD